MADFVGGVSLIIVGMVIGLLIGLTDVSKHKQEAFDRGFMVQCIGKTGYYWECE